MHEQFSDSSTFDLNMTQLKFIACYFAIACLISPSASEQQVHVLTVTDSGRYASHVDTNNPEKYYRTVDNQNIIAKSLWNPSYNETGWDFFEVTTNELFSDEDQAYAAGYLEGRVTHDMIYKHWYNSLDDFCNGKEELCDQIEVFIGNNLEWIRKSIESKAGNSDYWHQVKLYYKQLEGLADGYASVNKDPSQALGYREILMMNTPDLGDIVEMIQARKSNFTNQGFNEDQKVLGLLRCSALIKILPDGSELFSAQDTWSEYASMLRYQKKYNFGFHNVSDSNEIIPGRAMTFSSYPGVITSGDDFYVISSGLVTMETTIGNSNVSLWKEIKPVDQVSEGVRSMVANRLARDGKSWSDIFSQYNSGTYNNQWMVVDYKRFKKGTTPKKLQDNLLWVVEQIPGLIHSEDMTSVLRDQGYWPSYNVAYFKQIFNASGNQALVDKYGDWFTYEKTPRANIFRRDHVKVNNLKSMLALMRYNDFKHDDLSKCDCTPPYSGENAIAARCDLNPASGTYPFPALGHRSHGATDAKITSNTLFLNGLQFLAVSGPPHNAERGIPPFQWSTTDFGNTTRHLGHPDLWVFKPIIYKWI